MSARVGTDLHWLTVAKAAHAIARRELSPVELTQALLKRIERLDPRLNAFIRVDGEAALQAARTAEAEVMAGRLRGPLHGVPVGVKDIIDVAGLPTTGHSKVLADSPAATADAVCVSKLRQSGAIILGKLSTHEFAIGGPSHDLPWPPARNPWNPGHHPGGSSSGFRLGRGGRAVPHGAGFRHRRQRAQSRVVLRHRRHQANLWAGVAVAACSRCPSRSTTSGR